MEYIAFTSADCPLYNTTKYKWKIYSVNQSTHQVEKIEEFYGLNFVINGSSLQCGTYLISFKAKLDSHPGTKNFQYGFVEVSDSPPILKVTINSQVLYEGYHDYLSLDASLSHDASGNSTQGLSFYWFCKRQENNVSTPDDVYAAPLVTYSGKICIETLIFCL